MMPILENVSVWNLEKDITGINLKDNPISSFTYSFFFAVKGFTQYFPIPMSGKAKRLKIKYYPFLSSDSIKFFDTKVYANFEYSNGQPSPSSINPEYMDLYPVDNSENNLISFALVNVNTPQTLVSVEIFNLNI